MHDPFPTDPTTTNPEAERLLLSFDLRAIESIATIELICKTIWEETERKASVEFLGSKGYLNFLQITAEMTDQVEHANRIDIYDLRKEDGSLQPKIISLHFHEDLGFRLEVSHNYFPIS